MPQIHTVTLNPVIDLIYETDRFEKGTTFRCGRYEQIPAGKGINVSYALSYLGETSHAYLLIGEQELSLFGRVCHERGIQFHPFAGPFQTRYHCTILERATGSVTHVQTTGMPVPSEAFEILRHVLEQQIGPGDILVLSGSIAPGLPAPAYRDLIELSKAKGALTILDSSGPPLRLGTAAGPYVIKANEKETQELTGLALENETQEWEALRRIREIPGLAHGVISLGERGMIAGNHTAGWRLHVPMRPGEVKDTVGCGDSLVAGLALGLKQGMQPPDLYRFAIACASAAAAQTGPGRFEKNAVETMLSRVVCVKLT
ncbi:MAG TPA: hexose kinase [bacterium]|nr:hexose kinase [bacterium]HOL94891.1 hexose kinase [bacterium]HXK92229.1 hexose kinase [bacterium]